MSSVRNAFKPPSIPIGHRVRVWLARTALVIVSLSVVFGIGELYARRLVADAFREAFAAREAARDSRLAGLPVLRTTREIAKPNTRGVYQGVLYRTNEQGFRGPARSPEAADGVTRILVTGDSVTMGNGVYEEETYSALLASRLSSGGLAARAQDRASADADSAAMPPPTAFEVINLGIAGANIALSMDRLERGIDAYGADLLVYGFTINDIEGPHYRGVPDVERAGRQEKQRGPFPGSRSILLRWISARIGVLGAPRSHRDTWYAQEFIENYDNNEPAVAALLAGFDRFASIARERGLCGHVLIHTHLSELGETHAFLPIYSRIAEAARQRGLGVVESWPAFRGLDASALWVSPFNPHPGPRAHGILADALAASLIAIAPRCIAKPADAPRS
jgi:hypothetical protein